MKTAIFNGKLIVQLDFDDIAKLISEKTGLPIENIEVHGFAQLDVPYGKEL